MIIEEDKDWKIKVLEKKIRKLKKSLTKEYEEGYEKGCEAAADEIFNKL